MASWTRISLSLVLLSGCVATEEFESDRPFKQIREPVVNTDTRVRYFTRMSEDRGLKALRRLAETSDFEESWVYIPRIKQWEEIGINEGKEIVDEKDPRYRKKSVELDGRFLKTVAEKYKEFTIYHTHNVKKKIVSKTVFYNPECSLPSYEDLCIDLKIFIFYARLNEGHSIKFKSVSLLGVTEVLFSRDAQDHYEELLTAEETVRNELSRLEGFNFLKPFHATVFQDRIRIEYRPLVTPK